MNALAGPPEEETCFCAYWALVQIKPSQPEFLLFQSLPQTLQPSEFPIFVIVRVSRIRSNSEFNADALADNFRLPVTQEESPT